MKTVLVTLDAAPRHRALLEAAAPGCRFVYMPRGEVTPELAAEAAVILGRLHPSIIAASPRLELLQLDSAGADLFVKPGVLAPGTRLCNATGAYSQSVAEHAFAMMLALQKHLPGYRDAQRRAEWTDLGQVSSVAGSTVLVVGLGDIGRYFAGLVKALGAYVIGLKRRPGDKPDCVDELYTTEELDAQLPRADVIFSVLPATPATAHLYTAERFRLMKPGAYFINCGRGSAVDTEVLRQALESHEIAGAAIDVVETEPLPADSPLWALDDLLITPHVAGDCHLPETFERIVAIAARNLAAWYEGREPENLVDFATGYKA